MSESACHFLVDLDDSEGVSERQPGYARLTQDWTTLHATPFLHAARYVEEEEEGWGRRKRKRTSEVGEEEEEWGWGRKRKKERFSSNKRRRRRKARKEERGKK